jgi:hypothetical protein
MKKNRLKTRYDFLLFANLIQTLSLDLTTQNMRHCIAAILFNCNNNDD